MPRLDIPEPPFITSLSQKENDTLNQWLLEVHNLISGIGSDGTPLFDDDNISSLVSDTVTEGASNVFYTSTRFTSDLATKDTGDLVEGSNLYFTDTRAQTSAGTYHNAITGNHSDLKQSSADVDSTATVTSADASDLATVITLANEIKGDVNTLVADHNDLKAKLRTAGLLAT